MAINYCNFSFTYVYSVTIRDAVIVKSVAKLRLIVMHF